ncbi:hypothetical protein GGR57DRAFT_499331 [Xylariaceae sp. FL1272]|nr:hypothetical protein GGR57DRAFT_499331 [Xylariaceae sp. FL1272]
MTTFQPHPSVQEHIDDYIPTGKKRFMDMVNGEVTKCMQANGSKAQLDYNAVKVPQDAHPLSFQAILGSSDEDGHWWRLYIEPMWWAGAEIAPNPRLYFDEDSVDDDVLPKGFHAAMVNAYKKYLRDGELNRRFGADAEPLSAEEYIGIFQACLPNPTEKQLKMGLTLEKLGKMKFRDEAVSTRIQFGGPERLASDVEGIRIKVDQHTIYSLVTKDASKKDQAFAYWDGDSMEPTKKGQQLKAGIAAAFRDFKSEIHDAKLHSEQLRAIAKLIRSLHIMHAFTDGCGRTNILTLLPLLLLRYGFGLTLGGEHAGEIQERAIFMMFNGGYTVDEMARFLWVSQDFGLMGNQGGRLAKKSCLGDKGTTPVPA